VLISECADSGKGKTTKLKKKRKKEKKSHRSECPLSGEIKKKILKKIGIGIKKKILLA